jgi:hypothetical protein
MVGWGEKTKYQGQHPPALRTRAGEIFEDEALAEVIEQVRKRGLLIVSDELGCSPADLHGIVKKAMDTTT